MKFSTKKLPTGDGSFRHNNQRFAPGSIIESDRPLDTMFPQRFLRLPTEEQNTPVTTGRRTGRRRKKPAGEVAEAVKDTQPSALRIVPKGKDAYDVVNTESGKALNAKPLTLDEARDMVEDASGDGTGDQS